MKQSSPPKTSASKRPDRNLHRQQAAAINLAQGMSPEKALVEAGYSRSYAHDQGYKAVKRPCIQSLFTDSCERILAKRKMQFDEILEPYFDALKAPLIVKSTQLGDAQIPKDEHGKEFPNHAIRMDAADRIVGLYGGKPRDVDMPTESPRGITIIIRREASTQAPIVVNPTGRTSIVPEGTTNHPTVPVRFIKPNGSNGHNGST